MFYNQKLAKVVNKKMSTKVLREILAELYPDIESMRRIIYDSSIEESRIALNSSAINNWHAILTEADRLGKIDKLIGAVESEYSGNPEFSKACNLYRESTYRISGIHTETHNSRNKVYASKGKHLVSSEVTTIDVEAEPIWPGITDYFLVQTLLGRPSSTYISEQNQYIEIHSYDSFGLTIQYDYSQSNTNPVVFVMIFRRLYVDKILGFLYIGMDQRLALQLSDERLKKDNNFYQTYCFCWNDRLYRIKLYFEQEVLDHLDVYYQLQD